MEPEAEAGADSTLHLELLFLISKFLSTGPCQHSAQVLRDELEKRQLLPATYDWTGRQRQQSHSDVERRLPHIAPDHLARLMKSFTELWGRACSPPVASLTSLLNGGTASLLDTRQASRVAPLPLLALVTVRAGRPLNINLKHHVARPRDLVRSREYVGRMRKKQFMDSRFFAKFHKYRRLMGHLCASYCVLYDRTGSRVFTGADDCLVKVWSAHDGLLKSTLRGHESEVADIAIDIENRLIASGGCDKVIRVWNLQTRKPVAVLLGHSGIITTVQFCPFPSDKVKYLISTGADGNVCFWEYSPHTSAFCSTPTKFVERGKPGDQILCSSVSSGGVLVVCGGTDHVVRLYQVYPGPPERLAELDGHTDRVQSVQFAHQGTRFISGGRDGTARVWSHEGNTRKCVVLSMHTKHPSNPNAGIKVSKLTVTMISWDLHDRHVITACSDTLLKVWKPDTGELVHDMKGHDDVVFVLEPHPTDEHILMSAGHDGALCLWNLSDGTMIKRFDNCYGNQVASIFDAKFSPNGLSIACCDSQGQVTFFGVPETKEFEKAPDQQFFHTDYHPLIRDVNNHVIDEQTELAPHVMNPPLLVNMDCNPYPPETQCLVTGYVKKTVAPVQQKVVETSFYDDYSAQWKAVEVRRAKLEREESFRQEMYRQERESFARARRALSSSEEDDSDDGGEDGIVEFGESPELVVQKKRSMSIAGDVELLKSPPSVRAMEPLPLAASTNRESITSPMASTPMLAPRAGSMLDTFAAQMQDVPIVGPSSSASAVTRVTSPGPSSRIGASRALRSPATVSVSSGGTARNTPMSPRAAFHSFASGASSSSPCSLSSLALASQSASSRDAASSDISGEVSSRNSLSAATPATEVHSDLSLSENTPSRDFPATTVDLSLHHAGGDNADYSSTPVGGGGSLAAPPVEEAMDTATPVVASARSSLSAASGDPAPVAGNGEITAASVTDEQPGGERRLMAPAARENLIQAADADGDGLGDEMDVEGGEVEAVAMRATSLAERYVRQQHAANNALLLHVAATECSSVDVIVDHWKKRTTAPPLRETELRSDRARREAFSKAELNELNELKQNAPGPVDADLHRVNSYRRFTSRSKRFARRGQLVAEQNNPVVVHATSHPPPNGRGVNGERAAASGTRFSARSDSAHSLRRSEESGGSGSDVSVDYRDLEHDLDRTSSSQSSPEESDCSDWSEDAGIARAARAARRRQVAEAERRAQASSAHASSAASSQQRKKKKPAKPKPERVVNPADLVRFQPSDWITSVEPLPSPYFPQQGDKVVYCRQGHEAYVNNVKENKVYRLDRKMIPWTRKKLPLRAHEVCYVVNVHFVVGPPSLCTLKLRLISSCPGRADRATFSIQYHDYEGLPDFIVLYSRVKEAIEAQWKVGDSFRSMIDDQYWQGTIVDRTPFDEAEPDSLWQCFSVRWDTDENENVSPWDLERLPDAPQQDPRASVSSSNGLVIRTRRQSAAVASVAAQGHGQAVIDTHNWLLPAEENDENEMGWEVADAENEQKRILDGLIKVQAELDIAQPFSYLVDYEVAYPQYCVCVALPTCLENIICKMRNKFYRRKAALLWEVRLLEKNANAFNEEDSDIVRSSKALVALLCKFIKLTVCHDPLALYHSGDTLSGEEDEEADEADGDNGEDNMADNGDAPVMASGNSRSSPSLITNGTVSTGGGRNLSAAAGRLTRGKASIYADWDLNSDEGEEEDLEAFSSPPPEGEKRLTRGAKQQISETYGVTTDEFTGNKMTATHVKSALKLVDVIAEVDTIGVFTQPVDLSAYPDYLQYVEQPMDFQTLRKNLKAGVYGAHSDFLQDLLRIFANSRDYNSQKSSEVYRLTSRLIDAYDANVVNFLKFCNNGHDIPSLGITSHRNKRVKQEVRTEAVRTRKRRRQASSSSSSSADDSSSSGTQSSSEESGEEEMEVDRSRTSTSKRKPTRPAAKRGRPARCRRIESDSSDECPLPVRSATRTAARFRSDESINEPVATGISRSGRTIRKSSRFM